MSKFDCALITPEKIKSYLKNSKNLKDKNSIKILLQKKCTDPCNYWYCCHKVSNFFFKTQNIYVDLR